MLADLGTVQLLWSSDSSATPGVSELSSRNKAWQPPEVGVLLLCVELCLWDAAVWRGVSVDLLPLKLPLWFPGALEDGRSGAGPALSPAVVAKH